MATYYIAPYHLGQTRSLSSPPEQWQTKPLPIRRKMAYKNTQAHGRAQGLSIVLYTASLLVLQNLCTQKDIIHQTGAVLAGRNGLKLVTKLREISGKSLHQSQYATCIIMPNLIYIAVITPVVKSPTIIIPSPTRYQINAEKLLLETNFSSQAIDI